MCSPFFENVRTMRVQKHMRKKDSFVLPFCFPVLFSFVHFPLLISPGFLSAPVWYSAHWSRFPTPVSRLSSVCNLTAAPPPLPGAPAVLPLPKLCAPLHHISRRTSNVLWICLPVGFCWICSSVCFHCLYFSLNCFLSLNPVLTS